MWPSTTGSSPKFWASPFNISAAAEVATSNLVNSLGLPRPIIKSHREEKVKVALGYGSSSKFWGFPYNISATAGASDLKFGKLLGFIKAHHKIIRRRRRKGGHGPGLGEVPKFWGFPFNIYRMAETSDFKFSKFDLREVMRTYICGQIALVVHT